MASKQQQRAGVLKQSLQGQGQLLQGEVKMYFQHQDRNLLCGMHSLNNFLSQPKYTVDSMNDICYTLTDKKILNPHRHWLMQGDYDVNVLMYALQLSGFSTKWHDKRKVVVNQHLHEAQGVLVNVEVGRGEWFRLGGLFCSSGRHWLVVKKHKNAHFNSNQESQFYMVLDSSKQAPELKSQTQTLDYINQVLKQAGQVIYIYKLTGKES